jgi:hypothetical protein
MSVVSPRSDMNRKHTTERVASLVDGIAARWVPGVLRWTAALLWLGNISWKRPPDFGRSGSGCGALCGYVQAGIDHPVLPGSAWLFEHVISPHLWAFGWFTILGEGTVAVLLASGRFRRTAGVAGIMLSIGILAAVANAPGEWYWSYILMIALHLAVIVTTAQSPQPSARPMGIVTVAFGAAMALVHISEGFTGTAFSAFKGGGDLPGDLIRNLFGGSVALGLLLALIGVAGLLAGERLAEPSRRLVGVITIVAAAVVFLTYSDDGTIIGLGSTTTSACVLDALGLSLAITSPSERAPTAA